MRTSTEAYVGRVERGLENPTIGILDRLAKALSIHISELFLEPKPGDSPPKPLRSGRRSKSVGEASQNQRTENTLIGNSLQPIGAPP